MPDRAEGTGLAGRDPMTDLGIPTPPSPGKVPPPRLPPKPEPDEANEKQPGPMAPADPADAPDPPPIASDHLPGGPTSDLDLEQGNRIEVQNKRELPV